MPESEKLKSLLYVLTGILFVLVLLDKSTGAGFRSAESGGDSGFFSKFNTIGKTIPQPPQSTSGKQTHEEVMDQAEDEILSELMQNGGQNWSESESTDSDDLFIPVVDNPKAAISESFSEERIHHEPGEIELYFLKFYGKGSKSHSRLVQVKRKHVSGDKVHFILKELSKGPDPDEKRSGVLNALPPKFTYSTEYSVENGILRLSLGSEFETGAGPELLKDRVDQLCYSLLENLKVKGIRLYINGKKVHSLGGVGFPVPDILTKNPRKIAVL
ncbi:sporulation and spore germination [Leptospira inadai serovar Lyme str. 10]|uniref:Sporulation and spore germination n=2 Tax=Leptospira inadai serovar Lyme TaxID=293084 RepID=V6HD37_9LEPT|nr:GerMN domain-containing protein [Leptospira inadai]EQA37951.1 sporulation and spore germination [Leptospira inadai serovar Lyme str. 10]PNV73032.1 spore gernimation protein [Leptospira inadai serovar Lyme]